MDLKELFPGGTLFVVDGLGELLESCVAVRILCRWTRRSLGGHVNTGGFKAMRASLTGAFFKSASGGCNHLFMAEDSIDC